MAVDDEDDIIIFSPGQLGGDIDPTDSYPITDGLRPIGVDLAWDFEASDLALTRDLKTVWRTDTIRQWCVFALATARGTEVIYGGRFGSRWRQRHREMAIGDDMRMAMSGIVTDALTVHDRISDVVVYGVEQSPTDSEVVAVSFTVVLDDGTEIDFPEAQF